MTQIISSSTLMACYDAYTKLQACQPFWCNVCC